MPLPPLNGCLFSVSSINHSELIAGTYGDYHCITFVFIYNTKTGNYTTVCPMYESYECNPQIDAIAINDNNIAVVSTSSGVYLYDYNNNAYTPIPKISQGGNLAFNNNKQLLTGSLVYNLQSGEINTLKYPGSEGTSGTGINNSGEIVGYYVDSSYVKHGFLAIPDTEAPELIFDGMNIVENGSQNMASVPSDEFPPAVVVGQQIVLQAILPKSFGPVASQEWLVAGNPIGGYSPTPASFQTGSVLPWVSNQLTTQFYWTIPTTAGAYYAVKYSYKLQSGQSGTVETKFSVTPPPALAVNNVGFYEKSAGVSCKSNPSFCDIYDYINGNGTEYLAMGFGNTSAGTTNYGMAIGTDLSPGNGSYFWVQLIRGAVYIWSDSTGKQTRCNVSPGLDTTFPYSTGSYVSPSVIGLSTVVTATSDQPLVNLIYNHPSAVQVSAAFKAEMFLMWQSNILPSIPVPLGSVTWSFAEASIMDMNAPNGWTTPTVTSQHGGFSTETPSYPVWPAPARTTSISLGKC
jgi:hypothetical protein